jgi:hypothetical protein
MAIHIKERKSGIQEKPFILMKGMLRRSKRNNRLEIGKDVKRVG